MYPKHDSITEDIKRTIFKSFYLAIDKNDIEMFYTLNTFLNRRLVDSYQENDINSYTDYSKLFVYYYEYALNKLSNSITKTDIYEACSDRSVRGLKEKINFGQRFGRIDNVDIEEQRQFNKYATVLLDRFSELIFVTFQHKNIGHLTFILNQLQQVTNNYDHSLSNLRLEIQIKERSNPMDGELRELRTKEDKYFEAAYIDKIVRIIFKVTIFWSIYLHQRNILSTDELNQVFEIFETYKGYIQYDFLSDILALRDESLGYNFSWHHWDYIKRPEGVVYSPPSVHEWATFGAIIYILKFGINIRYDLKKSNPENANSFEYLLIALRDNIKSLVENGYKKWGTILKTYSIDDYEKLFKSLQDRLDILNVLSLSEKEKRIASLPIDKEYSSNFMKQMVDGWRQRNSLRELFDHFKNVTFLSIETSEQDLFQIGSREQLWIGYKMHLINDPEFNHPIFGLDNIGLSLATNEENFFINRIISEKKIAITENLLPTIDTEIERIFKNGFSPSAILIGFDFWDKEFFELNSPDFILDWSQSDIFPYSDYGGAYKNIPIVRFRSDLLRNSAIVADFAASFQIEQKKFEDDSNGILKVSITEIDAVMAEQLFIKNAGYWGSLPRDQALIKIQNAVLVNFFLLERIIVKNLDAYSIITNKS